MSPIGARRLSARAYERITLAALVSLVVIVITGALVRLTGSGLGCTDWPNCNESRFVDVSSTHGAIEQLNRLFTGVVALAVVLAVLGSLRRAPRRADLTWLSLGLVAGVIGQVVLGGVTVLVDLHPAAVQGHFLLSMVLCANAFELWRRAGAPDGSLRVDAVPATERRATRGVLVGTALAIVTGTVVTGTGPHGGDEDARRFGFDIGEVARVHGAIVLLTLAGALWLGLRVRRGGAATAALEAPLSTYLGVGALQAVVGYTQYFTGVPVVLVAAHVTGATMLWLAALHLARSSRADRPTRSVVDGIGSGRLVQHG